MWVKLEGKDRSRKGKRWRRRRRRGRLIYGVETGASPPTYLSSAPRLSNCPPPPPADETRGETLTTSEFKAI